MEFPPYRHQIVFQSDCTSFSLSCNIYEFVTPFKFRNGHSILTELCATLTLIYKWLQFSLWVWVAMTSTSGSSWSSHVVSKVKGSTMIVCLMGLNYTSQKTAPLLGPADFLWDGQECRVEGSFCPLTTHMSPGKPKPALQILGSASALASSMAALLARGKIPLKIKSRETLWGDVNKYNSRLKS